MNDKSRLKRFLIELKNDKVAIFTTTILFIIILGAIFAFLSPYDPSKTNISERYLRPSLTHMFGTDNLGRDYMTRALYGARTSLLIGFLSMAVSGTISLTLGTISGYYGGVLDSILMRFLDVIMSIPWLVLVIVIQIFLKPSVTTIIIVIACTSWMSPTRLIRAETLSYKEREYVLYAKASGQSNFNIILKHILPAVFPTFLVAVSIGMAGAIITESSLSFLGLGVPPQVSTWGSMLSQAQNDLTSAPYLAFLPGFLIFITIYSLNKLSDVLRLVIEPRTGVKN